MPCSITNERCFITACNTSFDGEGDGAGEGEGYWAGEGEAEGRMWDYLLWLWGHNMSTSRGFCSIEFFQFLQLPFSLKIGRSLGRSSTISGVLQQLLFTLPTLGSTSNAIVVEPEAISSMQARL